MAQLLLQVLLPRLTHSSVNEMSHDTVESLNGYEHKSGHADLDPFEKKSSVAVELDKKARKIRDCRQP